MLNFVIIFDVSSIFRRRTGRKVFQLLKIKNHAESFEICVHICRHSFHDFFPQLCDETILKEAKYKCYFITRNLIYDQIKKLNIEMISFESKFIVLKTYL